MGQHPKIKVVKDIVKDEIKAGAERIILFCHFRDMARQIEKKLTLEGVNAVRFVGQATREKEDKGLTQKEQKSIIDKFRNGEIRVLVATSVAEEGLDIPAVDVAVFYEAVPSEIRYIQRSGRTGRQEKGKVIILTSSGTRDEAYYFTSLRKEKRMKKTLESLKKVYEEKNKQKTLSHFEKRSKDEVFVYVDHREKNSGIVELLSGMGVKVKEMQLEVGDFLVSDRAVIERKTCSDFINSIIDGRLFKQSENLIDNFSSPVIILEGKQLFGLRNIHDNAIRGAIISICVDYGIPIIRTTNTESTALYIKTMAKREQLDLKKSVRLRGSKKPLTVSEQQRYVLEGLPKVGPELARNMLLRFKTLTEVFSASEKELREVEQLGEKKAKNISRLINEEYEE